MFYIPHTCIYKVREIALHLTYILKKKHLKIQCFCEVPRTHCLQLKKLWGYLVQGLRGSETGRRLSHWRVVTTAWLAMQLFHPDHHPTQQIFRVERTGRMRVGGHPTEVSSHCNFSRPTCSGIFKNQIQLGCQTNEFWGVLERTYL